jgi:hypothetical protein
MGMITNHIVKFSFSRKFILSIELQIPAKSTQFGKKYGYYDYQLNSPDDRIITIGPSPFKFVLRAGFEIKAPQLERRRRYPSITQQHFIGKQISMLFL